MADRLICQWLFNGALMITVGNNEKLNKLEAENRK